VVITGWSNAPIPWPRCRRLDTRGGGSGLLVDDELARAVRRESSVALQHWFGVSPYVVWSWRKALGVERFNEGSVRLQAAWNAAKGAALKGKPLPPEQVERRRRTARELGLRPPGKPNRWTADDLALLGTMPDEEVAGRIGRTATAVRVMRTHRAIPSARDRRRRENRGGP
jgi:hypothetical protein